MILTRRKAIEFAGAGALAAVASGRAKGLIWRGGGTNGGGGGGFAPQPGFSYSGSPTDGGSFTINGPSGSFGTKPVDPRPLLWLPVSSNLTPSSLGRTTAITNVANMSFQSSGGPGGAGYAQGAPVVSGDAGTQKQWTAAVDITQWGAGSPYISDYSAKYYLWRTKYRNWGAYTGSTYNIKVRRCYANASTTHYPNFYMASNNWTLGVEDDSGAVYGSYTPVPQPPDNTYYTSMLNNINAFSGGVPGTPNAVTFDNWFSEEWLTRSNTTNPSTSEPSLDATSLDFRWYVEGLNSNNPAFTTPYTTYQANNFYLHGSNISLTGNIYLDYFWHDIIDGSGGRNMLPNGSYVGYGPSYLDDSWCRGQIRDSSTRSSFTMMEIQIPTAWSDTSISWVLRKGRFASLSGHPFIITDNNGVEHYVGDFT